MSLKSNGSIELTRDEAVARALDCTTDLAHYYGLGRGGRKPGAVRPYDAKWRVDCSGFVSWCLGLDRYQVYFVSSPDPQYEWAVGEAVRTVEKWLSTDGILNDALGERRWFEVVSKGRQVLPGDVLVYGDYKVNGVIRQGHTGLIVDVHKCFVRAKPGWWECLAVAHATPSHRLKYGNVVATTDARIWRTKGYIVRFKGFKGEGL